MKATNLCDLPLAKPHFIEPMYAMSVNQIPEGDPWLYEAKLDGYRCLAGKDAEGITLWSRRGNFFTRDFPAIARGCEQLERDTLIDGEIIAIDETGRASFNLLQHHRSKASAIQFYVFDLLIYRGRSLLKVPLESRRELLRNALRNTGDPIYFSLNFDAKPAELIDAAKALSIEGIVAKRKDSHYESGKRSGAWLKYKINKSQEFILGGYTPGNPFDSLIVGYYEGSKLNFVAKVRNGFVPRLRRDVFEKFKGLQTQTCPFSNLPERKRTQWALTRDEMKNCHWLKPELVAQVEFTEWTPDGHLRQAKFMGLREDKNPLHVVREP